MHTIEGHWIKLVGKLKCRLIKGKFQKGRSEWRHKKINILCQDAMKGRLGMQGNSLVGNPWGRGKGSILEMGLEGSRIINLVIVMAWQRSLILLPFQWSQE